MIRRRLIRTRAQLIEAPILKAEAERKAAELEAKRIAEAERKLVLELRAKEDAKRLADQMLRFEEDRKRQREIDALLPPSKEALAVERETGINAYEADALIKMARATVAQDAAKVSRAEAQEIKRRQRQAIPALGCNTMRKVRIIRTRDKLPIDADRVANVSKAPEAPPPATSRRSQPLPPPTGATEAMQRLGVAFQRLGRGDRPLPTMDDLREIPRMLPIGRDEFAYPSRAGFRVTSIEERSQGVVHISAMGPDGIVASLDMDSRAYRLLRESGTFSIGATLDIQTDVDYVEREFIGQRFPERLPVRQRHSVVHDGESLDVSPFFTIFAPDD